MLNHAAFLPGEIDITWIDQPLDQQANILLDDELASDVASGRRAPTLRLWSGGVETAAIAVSRRDVQNPAGAAAAAELRRGGCSVLVRNTGGTAVPLGPGVLHASFLLPRSRERATTDAYYRLLCSMLTAWLAQYELDATVGPLPGSYCDGNYNVLVGERKLVGTAQAWRGGLAGTISSRPGYVLAHACITVDVDLDAGGACINRFYRLAGQPQIDIRTAVTLRDLLPGIFQGTAAAVRTKAAKDLTHAATAFLSTQGIACRLSIEPAE